MVGHQNYLSNFEPIEVTELTLICIPGCVPFSRDGPARYSEKFLNSFSLKRKKTLQ